MQFVNHLKNDLKWFSADVYDYKSIDRYFIPRLVQHKLYDNCPIELQSKTNQKNELEEMLIASNLQCNVIWLPKHAQRTCRNKALY